MKKVFLAMAVLFQLGSAYAQNKSGLLTQYFAVKDALVSGNSANASAAAAAFVKAAGEAAADKSIEAAKAKLVADAQQIATTQDLAKQREQFKQLSADMYSLAKTTKLSDAPVYQQYCPMKKASWLSANKDIKNPYYGNQMLTCGKVADTIE
ncbi:Protein of unknown function [Chitinophaga jiangningensis]|uniref:DUF3347 domain-containing protein n=1 Tax=Chitinophaga jiangningensis TaxID=1419482 RepID=A0A1M7CKA4_9BACT|nr:DUF3347 domain-containing protein [Chitinophaga jiangningensis]SHL67269.1 Protein of unknown function [Chitinophaga jiangningensis]